MATDASTPGPSMSYRALGSCGLRVSALGLGGWTTYGGTVQNPLTVDQIIRRAFEAGINFFDIADIYAKGEAERMMGKTLAQLPRHRLVISSKLFWPMSDDPNDRGLSRKHIMESVERSLTRIGTDYLDLYFCHRFDPETPMEETIRAMDDLVHQGKILYWGTSEWTGDQMRTAHDLAWHYGLYRPQVEQPQLSLLERSKFEADTSPAARRLGMGLVTWSPLASGLLTGKYDNGIPKGSRLDQHEWLRQRLIDEDMLQRVRDVKAVADRLGVSRSVLALAWCLQQPGVSSVITGATRLEQLEENLKALEMHLDEETTQQLDELFPCQS